MTYFNFLIIFVLLPILVLLVITWLDQRAGRPTPGFDAKKVPLIIAVHVIIALTYTTPWDNYLVATGVWYYNPNLVAGIVFGYVPIEEYTFFIVQTILVGLWWWFLARRLSLPAPETFQRDRKLVYRSTGILIAAWLFFTAQFFFAGDEWNYLGIIFFWALPPIIPQFLFGADILWHYRKLVFWAIFVPGLYLSLTDIIALNATTWYQLFRHPAYRRSRLLLRHLHLDWFWHDPDALEHRLGAIQCLACAWIQRLAVKVIGDW
jgi:lycopene beta-cyclase